MVMIVDAKGKIKKVETGAGYDGSKSLGDLDGWNEFESGSNDFIKSSYDILSKRSATLYHTYAPGQAAVDKQTEYAVGSGLVFRSQPDWNVLGISQSEAIEWAKRFQRLVHYKFSELNFYSKQNASFRGALVEGDSLLYILRDSKTEIDLVEFPGSVIDANVNDDNHTLGIGHDEFYRKNSFINREGKKVLFSENGRQNVVQFYIKKLPRQLRGYPLLYTIISLAKNDDRHMDATIAGAILEATQVFYTETENPAATNSAMQMASRSKASTPGQKSILEKVGDFFRMKPGNIMHFRPGEKINVVDKKSPGPNFDMFKQWGVYYVAMGTGTPPGFIMSKFDSSFSASKAELNSFEKSYKAKRKAFSDFFCYSVLKEIATFLILNGEISAPGFFTSDIIRRAYLSGIWLGPVPGHINPLQEVNANIAAVENGFISRGDAAFNYSGVEFDDMIKEWKRQEDLFEDKAPEEKAEIIEEENN